MLKLFIFFLLTIFVFNINGVTCSKRRHKRHNDNIAPHMSNADDCNNGQQNNRNNFLGTAATKEKMSNIALKAANEATEAVGAQAAAGEMAAQAVKLQLAEKAMAAAEAAKAALAGKELFVEQLQQELREAEMVVFEESSSLDNVQSNVEAALLASQQAQEQINILKKAMEIAKLNIGNSANAANGLQNIYTERVQLLEAAKNRVEMIMRQLRVARVDHSKTKSLAYKAACAARQAAENVKRLRRKALFQDQLTSS